MKKHVLLSLLFVLFAGIGMAQIPSLSLLHNGMGVANGEDIVFPGLPTANEIVADISIRNDAAVPVNVLVKKVEIQLVDSTTNTFCWGICFPPNVYISPDPITIGNGQINSSDFSGHYYPGGHPGLSIIRYVFYNQSDPTDSICFNAHYDAAVGIDDLAGQAQLSNAYPNPATTNTQFNYAIDPGVAATLVVRNMLGATISRTDLAGTGTTRISTRDFSEGIYFYSLIVNGKTTKSGKLIVQ